MHSEWSWDAPSGSMRESCKAAADLGISSIAFTEHVDLVSWRLNPTTLHEASGSAWLADGSLSPPPLDVRGYLRCIDQCRDDFPDLTILSGLEISEPHLFCGAANELLDAARPDRVLASLHTLPSSLALGSTTGDEMSLSFQRLPAHDVLREYLRQVALLVDGFERFDVLAHIDYPLRFWPHQRVQLVITDFEDEFRASMRALAQAADASPRTIRRHAARRIAARPSGGGALSERCEVDVETGEIKPVVTIVTDNGGPFRSFRFEAFIAGRPELAHVRTRVKTPVQNGSRERGFGTLNGAPSSPVS
ncbi:MAG: PHP domain-containing protein [Pseudonocardia sp.]